MLAIARSSTLLVIGSVLACAEPPELPREVAAAVLADRPDTPGTTELPPVFAASDAVQRFDSHGGSFRVHYAREGKHAVPAADENGDDIPDYVELVADEYDAVGSFYAEELGFERPLSDERVRDGNGGDGRFDVYLLDFPTSADGAFRREDCSAAEPFRCTGYMLHENDFNGRNYASRALATRILASHEYFHAIQAAYNAGAGVVVGEGTAVWASERFDPSLDDFEDFSIGYFERTARSLAQEPIGPVDPFAYGSALFFQFLDERFGDAAIRQLWEAQRAQGERIEAESWVVALDEVLQREYDSNLGDAFAEFVRWNLFTGTRADPDVSYERGDGYVRPSTENAVLPYEEESLRVFPLAAIYYASRARVAGPVSVAVRAERSLDGLRLLLAREVDGQITEVEVGAAADGVTLEAGENDFLYAAVINTRMSGESLRPDLCIGSNAARACDALGAAPQEEQPEEDDAPSEGSGCIAASSDRSRPGAPWVLGIFSLAILQLRLRARLRSFRARAAASRTPGRRSPPSETS